jgi:hypothetical protein
MGFFIAFMVGIGVNSPTSNLSGIAAERAQLECGLTQIFPFSFAIYKRPLCRLQNFT